MDNAVRAVSESEGESVGIHAWGGIEGSVVVLLAILWTFRPPQIPLFDQQVFRTSPCSQIRHDYIGRIGVVGRLSTESGAERGAATGGGERVAVLPTEGVHERAVGATRPLVLPETFDGTGSWRDWCFHFENVAAVNGWDDAQKLKWRRVRLTGRAQKALHRLQGPAVASFEALRDALRAPESRYTRYRAEFEARRKKANEGWADFADELRSLADKAYPELRDEEAVNQRLPRPIATAPDFF